MRLRASLASAIVILVTSVSTTHAQLYWDSNGTDSGSGSGDGTWSGTSNTWDDVDGNDTPSPWVPGSAAIFSSGSDSSGVYTVTVDGTHSASSLTFEDGFPTLTGGQIDLTGAGSVIVPSNIGQATINSVIGGSVGMTAAGQGVLLLGGANVYSGNTSIASATEGLDVRLTASEVFPDTSVVTLVRGNSNTALRLTHLTNSVTYNVNETIKSLQTTGAGTQPPVHIGANTLTLADPQGETTAAIFHTTAGGKVIKNGSGSITLGGATGNFAGGEFIVNDGNVTVNNNNVFGTNVNNSKLTINGGTLTYNGGLSMNTENLDIGGSFGVNLITTGNAQFFGGGNGPIVLKTSPTITVNRDPTRTVLPAPNNASAQNGVLILGGILQDDGDTPRNLIKDGEGILTLANPSNSYTGETTILNGYLRLSKHVGSESVVGDGRAGTARINLSGGWLTYNGSFNAGDSTRTLTVANAVRVTGNSGISYISNSPNLAAAGPPAPPADAHNIYFNFTSNDISTTGGTLTFSNDGVCTSNGNTCTFRPTFSGNFDYDGPVVVNNQINDVATGRLSSRNTVLQSTNSSGTQTWSNTISGTGSIQRSVAGGTTALTGANTYSGGTRVDGGTLNVSGASATLGTGNVDVSGGTLAIASGVANAIADAAMVSISGTGKMSLGAGINDLIAALTLGGVAQTSSGTYGSSASGANHQFDLWFTGTGVLTLPAFGQPGDYNEDGLVDAADYVFWRKLYPDPTGPALPNDDTSGVNNDDYDRWVANFGEPAPGGGGSGGVPEPGAIVLATMALFAAGASRRRQG